MADATVYCGMLVNSLSGVGIIILNKYIVSEDAFNYVVFLSFCHFLFTSVSTSILASVGFFTPKRITIGKRVTLAMVSKMLRRTSGPFSHVHNLLTLRPR